MHGESAYRKRFKRLARAIAAKELEPVYDGDYQTATKRQIRELEKQRVRVQEEKAAYRRDLRDEAAQDALVQELISAISRFSPIEVITDAQETSPKAIYAMLSDIHYGLSFSSYYSRYNPDIAKKRVMSYAQRLCQIGRAHGVNTIYVALLGDLISGNIHLPIRLENRSNAIAQVVGVSELISAFLYCLAEHFQKVIVADVSGNHSRLEQNPDNAMRAERLDALIPWYCRAKLGNIKHICFEKNDVDPTISVLEIFGKTYVAVHGDFDPDLKTAALRISNLLGKKIDCFLAGHMHIADMRVEDTSFIRNGAVVTGGDEYTSKKRLFGPAVQVALLLSDHGVEAVYPVRLQE